VQSRDISPRFSLYLEIWWRDHCTLRVRSSGANVTPQMCVFLVQVQRKSRQMCRILFAPKLQNCCAVDERSLTFLRSSAFSSFSTMASSLLGVLARCFDLRFSSFFSLMGGRRAPEPGAVKSSDRATNS